MAARQPGCPSYSARGRFPWSLVVSLSPSRPLTQLDAQLSMRGLPSESRREQANVGALASVLRGGPMALGDYGFWEGRNRDQQPSVPTSAVLRHREASGATDGPTDFGRHRPNAGNQLVIKPQQGPSARQAVGYAGARKQSSSMMYRASDGRLVDPGG
jgi:hypothetical protein